MKTIFTAILFLTATASGLTAPGDLDLSFGNNGVVTTQIDDRPYRDFEVSQTMLLQPDGKIVVCGNATDSNGNNVDKFFLARYQPNGNLDTSFGTGGIVLAPNRLGHLNLFDIALQADGKIVGVGEGFEVGIGYGTAVYRYNSDGSLDPSFSTDGVAMTPGLVLFGLATQPNGRIVGVGTISTGFVVVRYNEDGSLDTSFGAGGIVATAIGNDSTAHKAIIQPDGKIVVVGSLTTITNNTANNTLVLSRYNPDGSLDSAFGSGGMMIDAILGSSWEPDALLQTDGKIVATGYVKVGTEWKAAIVRFQPDGLLDTNFGQNGIFKSEENLHLAGGIALQPDGKLMAFANYSDGFAIVRLNTIGTLDTGFGENGTVHTPIGSDTDTSLSDGTLQPDGKILAFGSVYPHRYDSDIAILRYHEDSHTPFDYDGDGRTDLSVYRPSNENWLIMQSSGGIRVQNNFGVGQSKLAPADYDGDGKTDLAGYESNPTPFSSSTYLILNSSTFTVSEVPFGVFGDVPVPGDYDADGSDDIAIYRPATGEWWLRDFYGQSSVVFQWGLSNDIPVPADFNGDGVADMTVFRPSDGKWYTINSGNGAISVSQWGLDGDIPVAADYSGDGKADFSVYRPSNQTWYRIHSEDNSIHIITWGLPGDLPVPGDYDGDGKNDLAVFRPSNSTWYIYGSTSGIYSQPFGLTGDIPTPNAFIY